MPGISVKHYLIVLIDLKWLPRLDSNQRTVLDGLHLINSQASYQLEHRGIKGYSASSGEWAPMIVKLV